MSQVPDAKFIPFTGTSPQYGERTTPMSERLVVKRVRLLQ